MRRKRERMATEMSMRYESAITCSEISALGFSLGASMPTARSAATALNFAYRRFASCGHASKAALVPAPTSRRHRT